MAENIQDLVHIKTEDFECLGDVCGMKERTLSYALYVDIPEQPLTPEEVFKECCYIHKVLASSTSGKDYKNDYTGFFHKRQLPSETCEFIMIEMETGDEFELDNDDYGTYKTFGSYTDQPDLTTFVLDWKKVLVDLGTGPYKILKRVNLAGLAFDVEYLVYNLFEFSTGQANGTARIDVSMSGLLEKIGVDFTGTNFKTTLRVPGFFGRRETKWEEDNLIDRRYVKTQISMKQTNEFKFQTNMIPDCISNEIFDFLLFSDDIRMNDYNLNNHSYAFQKFKVKLESNEGTEHITTSRKVRVNLLFNDKIVNNNKRNY